jgi:dCMP deaminase
MEKIEWDDYFMTMVYLAATRSKDLNSHLGAVIVDDKNRIVSVGYNSFVRGINDYVPERQERPEKYFWFEHAERNAIYNAKRDLDGCRMYTNGLPCMGCARGIVQTGIKEVIMDVVWNDANTEKWKEHARRAEVMLEEAGVKLRFWEGDLLEIYKFRSGKKF